MRFVPGIVAVAAMLAGPVAAQTAMPVPPKGVVYPKGMVVYPDGKAYPEAPVGHRQPTMNSLPPGLARREQGMGKPSAPSTGRGGERDDIDPELRICRGC